MAETESKNIVDNNDEVKSVKRKKKRSANQMAKKLLRKKSRFNDSYELDYDTYQYLIRILEVLRTEFSTMDDKLVFANNIFEQMNDREVEYTKNQVGSRVMDSLMSYASFEVIQKLSESLDHSLRQIFSDKYGSHVLEKLIYVCADRGNSKKTTSVDVKQEQESKDKVDVREDQIDEYNKIVLKLCKYALNNMEEFIYDNYANRILRTVIECLGGFLNKFDNTEISNSKKTNLLKTSLSPRREVIQEYTDLLKVTSQRILNWPQFREFGKDNLTSGFLQTLLYSLNEVDSKTNMLIIKKITKDCFTPNQEGTLSNIFDSENSLRLLETCLAVAKPKRFSKLYEQYFKGNLKQLALTKNSNYSIQRLCDYCKSKEIFDQIFEEISEDFNEILEKQHTGVVLSLANACLRLQTKQGPFVNSIIKALKCDGTEQQLQLVPLISRLTTYDQLETAKKQNRDISIHLHGSLILQAILQFNKPIKIVNSLLAMSAEDLTNLFNDPRGSRILDAFMESKFVGEKSREKLAKLMKGYWIQLAASVHGSRCLDKFWQFSNYNQRLHIMEELASIGQSLSSSKTGRLIYNKLNVALFAKDKKLWAESQNKEEKTKALFASIVGE
ncbi:nucleolar protein 9 [Chelonus insularis]|uniref:nucleolar protein 9 n=1 Tax=Chelonus insularis TaxID=460826 RepID=UPI00158960BC|nr:nucleolar protein 9 [Chelonus insularis]